MSNITALVGQRVEWITIVRDSNGDAVDPSAFAFYVRPPGASGVAAEEHTWDGASWTSPGSAIATPARIAAGTFRLRVDLPHANASAGSWGLGWKSEDNGSGEGESSDDAVVLVRPSAGLP